MATSENSAPQGSKQIESNSSHHDIFEDPAISRALKEDPLFRLISRHWKTVCAIAVAAGIAWYMQAQFREASLARLGEGRERLATVHEAYSSALDSLRREASSTPSPEATPGSVDGQEAEGAKDGEEGKSKALARSFAEARSLLADAPEPYGEIAQLYRALDARVSGVTVTADDPGLSRWRDLPVGKVFGDEASKRRFLAELEALALARIAIDAEATIDAGRRTLAMLAESGLYAHAAAVVALRRVARSAEEIASADTLVASVGDRHPEQRDLIRKEIERADG